MRLANWKILIFLIPLLLIGFYLKKRSKKSGILYNLRIDYDGLSSIFYRYLPNVSRILLLLIIAFTLSHPQLINVKKSFNAKGINIVLAVDVSGSMKATDFSPNRFEAAKSVISDFISGRNNDRIGLTVFAGEAYSACPLTIDYSTLEGFLNDISLGDIKDGTAIGDGLAVSIAHLKKAKGKSKVIVLLTDGENNAGSISPELAANWAKEDNIKVYTIGVGSVNGGRIPVTDQFGRVIGYSITKLDEGLLKKIANTTGAKYFRATDEKKLANIYKEIDHLEKTKVKVSKYYDYKEIFPWFLWAALLLWLIIFIESEVLMRLP